MMNVPSVDVLGIHITEPFTWLTNWLVAVFSFYFGHILFRDKLADTSQKFWAIFFLFIGFASITGGTAHGFITYVGRNFHYAAWILTGVAIFAAEMAAIQLIENEKVKNVVRFLVYIQLMLMVSSVMYLQDFNSVRINSAIGLVGVVIPISYIHYKKHRDKRSALIMLGIIANMVPGAVHAFKISFNAWFNFNDISHILMILCFFILYRGARQNASVELAKKLAKAAA